MMPPQVGRCGMHLGKCVLHAVPRVKFVVPGCSASNTMGAKVYNFACPRGSWRPHGNSSVRDA
jgi:hypothetical protein